MNERTRLLKPSFNSINSNQNDLYNNENKRNNVTFILPSLENEVTYKDRMFSIRLCYICMFLSSVSFTICISSIWPFLQIIDKTTKSTSFFGWVVASFSIGQLIGSPVFGYWSSKMVNHKIPMQTCLILTLVANILYGYLQSIHSYSEYWMLLSRILMGIGAASAAIVRSYVSGATNVEERTAILANVSACQGLGFIIGPVLQVALVPLHYPGPIEKNWFHLNMYTSPAFLSVIIYFCLIIVLQIRFNEYIVLTKDTEKLLQTPESFTPTLSINSNSYRDLLSNLPPPDKIAIVSALGLFFISCFIFSFYETLSSPLTIDMYAWTKSEATLYNGLLLGGLGIIAVFIILITKFLSKKYEEKLLMTAGYMIKLIAAIGLLPWGHHYPSVEIPTIQPGYRNLTTEPIYNTTSPTQTLPAPRGCPLEYDWCYDTPIVQLFQLIIGFFLIVAGYTITNVMSFTIYSKLLGPWPQGTMMGILTSIGSTARALGPIVVSYLYAAYGPRISFIFLISLILTALTLISFTYKRYKEYKMP